MLYRVLCILPAAWAGFGTRGGVGRDDVSLTKLMAPLAFKIHGPEIN